MGGRYYNMTHSVVGLHAGSPCHGCGGIGDAWRALDAAGIKFPVYSVEGAGLIVEAAAFGRADPLIFRTLATDVAPYELPPNEAAARTWSILMERVPPEIKALKDRVWIEIGNEQNKQKADWLGYYYVELASYALANGYRMSAFAWSTGEPEPAHWQAPGVLAYLHLCSENPSRLAVSVHEYSLSADDIMAGYPWLVGRFQFLFDACDKHGIARPVVFVTEAGWTHNDLPHAEKVKADIMALAELYAKHPTIKAAFLWTIIGGGDKKTLAAELNALMPWLTDYTIKTRFPDVGTPPPTNPPPEIPMSNQLFNPSFEGGWTDSGDYSTTQNPNGWLVEWNIGGGFPNPYAPDQPYLLGECVHIDKHKQLPSNERDIFCWDGNWTLKVFAGNRCMWPRLKQTLALPEGTYRLSLPVWVDCYRWTSAGKDYELEPHHAQMMVKAGGQTIRDWFYLVAGRKNTPTVDIVHEGGALDIAVHLRANYATTNNFWLDGWSLVPVTVTAPPPPPPPVKHKAIVLKLPQDVTAAEWQDAAAYGYPFRHTMTASHDDMLTILEGGSDESVVKLAWPGRQPDVAKLIEDAGYVWTPLFDEPLTLKVWPVKGSPVVTQAFGANPADYAQFGLAGHEGVDMKAALNTPILAAAAGIVSERATGTNYGKYIRVSHPGGWRTTYAHLNAFADAVLGDEVAAGQVIGFAGSTGNSTGTHLHFGVNHETKEYTDAKGNRWPKGIHDPTPFLAQWLVAPPPAGLVDLLPYLRGDGRQYEVCHPTGQTETFQTQSDGATFWLVKNSQWEELYADENYIWRGVDTSPGGGRFYVQFEPGMKRARWMPRRMSVGQAWVGPGHAVQFYNKDDCSKSALNSGNATNIMRLVAKHAAMTWNGVKVDDVVELTNGTETWFYARFFGLVAWSSLWGQSAICAVHSGRDDLTRERLNCAY